MNKRVKHLIDHQGIGTGNYWSDLQWSNFIRAQGETACNGFTFLPGVLRRADLKSYQRYPFALRLADRFRDQKTILYVWRTQWTTYGASITDTNHVLLGRIVLQRGLLMVMDLEQEAGIKLASAKEAV